jgi:hypothetical protein
MSQQNEDKGKTTGATTPLEAEKAQTKPAQGELRDEELEGRPAAVRPAPPDPC